jgi:pyrimidine-nucleoside phosphorylase
MRVYDLIWKKREGGELTGEEIAFLIRGFVAGTIPDYQMSALCMAIFFRGMTFAECTALTLEMAQSGEVVDLSSIPGIKVDKHSTGGVGDKTSLVLLPLVAAAGVPVAKMSGRGLGHTGGTIDKLEAIPGFKTSLPRTEFLNQVARIGVALVGQSGNLVPADKKLYALRDLTATVESIPLIASSIVSKKLAAGADAVLLDVKYGAGAFIREFEQAVKLAETMVEIGNRSGRKFKAVLTNMNLPLGFAVGNSLEVQEAIATLKGQGPADLTELCIVLGGHMLWLAGAAAFPEQGSETMSRILKSGAALAKFREFVSAQGGDPEIIEHPSLLPTAPVIQPVLAAADGWVESVTCREIGWVAMKLGAGRENLNDPVKLDVGLKFYIKTGDFIRKNSLVAEVYASTREEAMWAVTELQKCYRLTTAGEVLREPLIKKMI